MVLNPTPTAKKQITPIPPRKKRTPAPVKKATFTKPSELSYSDLISDLEVASTSIVMVDQSQDSND